MEKTNLLEEIIRKHSNVIVFGFFGVLLLVLCMWFVQTPTYADMQVARCVELCNQQLNACWGNVGIASNYTFEVN